MHHIAMVWLTSRVLLKGLTKPDRPHILHRLDEDNPEELDLEITRTVREIMMEKKFQGSKVWILIGQLGDSCWAGYFCYGIGNDPHRAHVVEWAGSMSAHIRYHLLRRGFDPKGVNNLVRGSFDLRLQERQLKQYKTVRGGSKPETKRQQNSYFNSMINYTQAGWI